MTDKQIKDHCDKGLHNETNIVMEVQPIPFSIAGYYVTVKCNRCGKVFIKERLTNYTEYKDWTKLLRNRNNDSNN